MGLRCIIEAPNSENGQLKKGKRTLEIECAKEHKARIAQMDVLVKYIPYGTGVDKPSVAVDITVDTEDGRVKEIVTVTPRNCVLQDVDVPRANKGYFIDTVEYREENGTVYKFHYGTR